MKTRVLFGDALLVTVGISVLNFYLGYDCAECDNKSFEYPETQLSLEKSASLVVNLRAPLNFMNAKHPRVEIPFSLNPGVF